jgi:hypothetical protein
MKFCVFLALMSVNIALLNAEMPPVEAAAIPTPDAAAAAPADSAAGGATTSQLKWPDTVDLSEASGTLLAQNQSTNSLLFKQSEALIEKMTSMVNDLAKLRTDLYAKFFDLDHVTDIFVKSAETSKGALQQAAAGN